MSTEIAIRPAPIEMAEYLGKLIKVTGYKEAVGLAVIDGADMPVRVGVTDNPHGFLRITPDQPPLIVLRDDIPGTLWQSVIAHEFVHLLRWTADNWVLARIAAHEHEAYMRLVESTMKPLAILLMVGGMINVEWVDEESTP